MNKRHCIVCGLILLAVVVTAGVTPLFAQRYVDIPAGYGTLQAVLTADGPNRVADPSTVYRLHRGIDSIYILTQIFTVDSVGLKIQSTGSGPLPRLIWTTQNDGTPWSPLISVKGNLSLKGVFIEGVNTLAAAGDRIIRIQATGLKVDLDSVHFSMSAQSFLRVDNNTSRISLKNCRVANVFSDWSNARGIDNRDITIDTLWEVNNTWYRIGQRAYRGGAGNVGIINYAYFNHNTFVDIGDVCLSLGLTKNLVFTNNLISNVGFTGLSKTAPSRIVTLVPIPEGQSVFVTHNVFVMDTVAWRAAVHAATGNDSLFMPLMFSDTIDTQIAAQGLTNTNIFSPVTFTCPPDVTPGAVTVDSIMRWYWKDPVNNTKNASILKIDSTQLVNLAYSTSSPAYTFGDDGKPVGSTEWFGITVDAIHQTPGTALPVEYVLSQNYPNPFNPSTVISYSLPRAGRVSLAVYDVLGRQVANLVSGTQTAGQHQARFDARAIGSGMYFYRLSIDGYVVGTRSMMLLK